MVPVRAEQEEEKSFERVKHEAAASARALAAILERPNVAVEAVRAAERRTSAVLAELRMVAAARAASHTHP